ncbi:MAG: hypothetical protein KDD47_00205 [Acidobacteria bacterium]|nr:hypothetical protein [Acidobacteriota bacterium]
MTLRTPSKRSFWAVSLIFLSACAGCGDSSPPPEAPPIAIPSEPVPGGTLVVGYSSDVPGINEAATSSSQTTTELILRMFIRLLDEQPDYQDHPPSFEPRLATSYEWSEDHKVLTFHLRQDAVWSDGVPITAEDVRWTWQVQTSPEVAWESATMKEHITDVEVVDAHTVRYHFTHPYPGQLVQANEGAILPKHAWEKLPLAEWRRNLPWFLDHLVVSGPFTVESWKPQEEIVLKRNEQYYEKGVPYLERVVFRIVPDPSSQLTQLKSGAIDYLRQVPAEEARQIAEGPETKLLSFWPAQFTSVVWNVRNPLFAEAKVRRALAMGIDRQTIVDTLWYGYAKPAKSPVISSVWAHHKDLPPLPYDPEKARSLLAEVGWVDRGKGVLEKDGERFSFELLSNIGNRERIDAGVMIQDQLKRIGVEVKARPLEWNTVDQRMTSGNFGAVIIGLGLETSLDMTAFFDSGEAETGLNFGRYSNPRVDRLLVEIRSAMDLEATRPLILELQEILQEDQPQTYLWESQRLIGVRRRVQGAQPSPIGTLDKMRYWWIYPQG